MNPHVLIVDDADDIRRLYSAILEPFYTVHEAASGEMALQAVHQHMPDVVLLDLAMPGLDGYETCRRLKRMIDQKSLRIVVVSSHSNPEDLQMAFDAVPTISWSSR